MKKELLLSGLIATAMVLLFTSAVGAFERDNLLDRVRYAVLAEREFEGVVLDKPGVYDGDMHFTLRTNDALGVVQIGPKDFVQRSGFKLDAGQTVTVVGMLVVFADRQMVLAREIASNGSVFVVRDRNGQPLWKDPPIQMDPKPGDERDPIC